MTGQASPTAMASPTLWIDADACPGPVRDIVLRTADRRRLSTVFVADSYLHLPKSPYVSVTTVESGPDAADRHIADAARPGDIAVTQDIPLAAILVAKGVAVLDPRGLLHTPETIGERLSVRDFMDGLRGAGVLTPGPAPFGPKDRQRFADCLDRTLTKRMGR
jgi:uncharacterized protein YaiI (UPF0178 family)